jgi:hypothetical protein
MLPPLARGLPIALGLATRGIVAALEEQPIGAVVPDLLLAISAVPMSWPVPGLTVVEAHTLAALLNHPLTSPELITQAFLTPWAGERAVARLVRGGLVVGIDDGLLTATPAARADEVEIIAVEAKLRRWREALEQAESYRRFADRVYVALDGHQIRTTPKMLNLFGERGIGMLLQYQHTTVHVLDSCFRRPDSPDRILALDRLAAAAHP